MGILSFLVSCFSNKNNAKKREKLLGRIAEIIDEPFTIESLSGNANAGNMDFSQQKSWVVWEKDVNVRFFITFQYKKGKIILKDDRFLQAFNRKKHSIQKTYELKPLMDKYYQCPYKFEVSVNDYSLTSNFKAFIQLNLNDSIIQDQLTIIRAIAKEALTIVKSDRILMNVSFGRSIDGIPNADTTNYLFVATPGNNSYETTQTDFIYRGDFNFNNNKEYKTETLNFNKISNYVTIDLKDKVREYVKNHQNYTQGDFFEPKIWGEYFKNEELDSIANVEWQKFYAYPKKSYKDNDDPSKKIEGLINIYTKEIKPKE